MTETASGWVTQSGIDIALTTTAAVALVALAANVLLRWREALLSAAVAGVAAVALVVYRLIEESFPGFEGESRGLAQELLPEFGLFVALGASLLVLAGTAWAYVSPVVQRKRCPECAELVPAEAQLCRYCGHRFNPGGHQARLGAQS